MGKKVKAGSGIYKEIKFGDDIVNDKGEIISDDALVLNYAILRPDRDGKGFDFNGEHIFTRESVRWSFSNEEAAGIMKYLAKQLVKSRKSGLSINTKKSPEKKSPVTKKSIKRTRT